MLKKALAMFAARWGRPHLDFRDAFDLFRSGRTDEAERICDALIARGESFADAWYLKGLLFRQSGRNVKAIAAMRIAVEEAPDEPAYVLMLAELILSEQGHAAALPYFTKGSRLAEGQPMQADALADLGSALAGVFQNDEAHQAFRQALSIDPTHSAALVGEADLLYNESEPEAAQEIASKRVTSVRDTSARLLFQKMCLRYLSALVNFLYHLTLSTKLTVKMRSAIKQSLPNILALLQHQPQDCILMNLFCSNYMILESIM